MPAISILRGFRVVLVTLAVFAALPTARAAENSPVLAFAAASLTDALTEIGTAYKAGGGTEVVFSFAGSMTLARQIEASSGADLFIAADMESMDYLSDRGLILEPSRRDLLANRLVLIAPADSAVALGIAPDFPLAAALQGGRLSIADTLSVPAGRYAKAALTSLGVWQSVSDRLAETEDVRAALALVSRGEAPLGIVYATDALAEPRVRTVGAFPEDAHPPILYPAALTKDARLGAAAFLTYLQSTQARDVFIRKGFAVRAPVTP